MGRVKTIIRDLELEIEEEHEDEEPWSRRSLSANQARHHENRLDLVSD
jgi:hypothetical protein